jgi:putative ABC transport system permease protein
MLVMSEMAVSTVLLVGASLLVRSIVHLQRVDPGFDPVRLYSVQASLQSLYPKAPARNAFLNDLAERIEHVPGVQSVTISAGAPPSRNFMIGALQVEGEPLPPPGTMGFIDYNGVQSDYFRKMGIRLIEGSTITDTSRAAGQALVNAGFAKKYWPGKSALGRRLRVVYDGKGDWKTIVGVVQDALTGGLTEDGSQPMLYTSAADLFEPVLLVRATPGKNPIEAIRTLIAQADDRLGPPVVKDVDAAMKRTVARPRFTMALLVVFTALALVLAAVGLYGVMAYSVAQQTREIGIRIALGATRSTIARSVLRRGVVMAVVGAAIGIVGARFATRLLEH